MFSWCRRGLRLGPSVALLLPPGFGYSAVAHRFFPDKMGGRSSWSSPDTWKRSRRTGKPYGRPSATPTAPTCGWRISFGKGRRHRQRHTGEDTFGRSAGTCRGGPTRCASTCWGRRSWGGGMRKPSGGGGKSFCLAALMLLVLAAVRTPAVLGQVDTFAPCRPRNGSGSIIVSSL